jgi:hypothetical protein
LMHELGIMASSVMSPACIIRKNAIFVVLFVIFVWTL